MDTSRPYGNLLLGISFTRIILGLVFVFIFQGQKELFAAIGLGLIVAAQVSDHLDGWIARKYSFPNKTGYVQDSLADKAFQFAVLISVSREYQLDIIIVWAVFLREIALLSIRILKNMNHTQMQKLRPHSIAFAVLLRGGCLGLVSMPLISPYVGLSSEVMLSGFTFVLYGSVVPAVTGLISSLRARRLET